MIFNYAFKLGKMGRLPKALTILREMLERSSTMSMIQPKGNQCVAQNKVII